jgi:eukaryotic-like serine/threonine-protein kinase
LKPLGPADPTVIASYQILGVLGSGGMAKVYLARSQTGRRLAIKVIRADLAGNPLIRQRFAHEVAAVRRVSPLFTAPIVDADTDAEEPWLATTFIDGPSLDDWVGGHGPLPLGAVLTLAAGLAEALASIHEAGLVHRDLKPGNVLLDDAGPHIIDFGVALLEDATRLTVSLVGTPAYMAPERLRGEDGTPEADIFSLGATLAYAATGKGLVGQGTVYAQVMQIAEGRIDLTGVPAQVRSLIAWCLSRRPRDRPSAAELTRLLADSGVRMAEPGWYRDEPDGQAAPVVRPRVRPLSRPGILLSRRRALAVGGLCVAGVGAGIAAATLTRGGARPAAAATGPGSLLWQVHSGARPPTGDPVPGERILVYPAGRVVALGTARVSTVDTTGRRVWSLDAPGDPLSCWRWGDAVLVNDGTRLRLVDAANGVVRFTVAVPAPVQAAAASGDRVYLDTGTGTVCLNGSGTQVWQRPPIDGAPGPRDAVTLTVDGGHLLIQERYGGTVRTSVADPGTGRPGWTVGYTVPPPAPPSGPPPGDGGPPDDPGPPHGAPPPPDGRLRLEARLAAGTAVLRFGQDVRAVRWTDGGTGWQRPFPKPIADLALAGDRLVVGADQVTAHDLATGDQLWTAALPLRGARVVAARAGVLAVNEEVVALLDAAGKPGWQVPLPASVAGMPPDRLTVDGRTAYLTLRGRPGDRPPDIDTLAFAIG